MEARAAGPRAARKHGGSLPAAPAAAPVAAAPVVHAAPVVPAAPNPPPYLFAGTLFVLLSASAVFFAGSVAAPAIIARTGASAASGGLVTAAVQVGFVVGTLAAVGLDLPDRIAPRRLLPILLVASAAANLGLATASSLPAALAWRFAAGALAGPVYPMGMRLLATWYASLAPRLGILLAAYTAGAGVAALLRSLQAPYAWAIAGASVLAVLGAATALLLRVGPRLPARARLDPAALARSYRVPAYRWSSFGYFGHMWELFAFWGLLPFWLEAAGWTGTRGQALLFAAYAAGALGCLWAGHRATRTGAAPVARIALGASGLLCVASPAMFAAPDAVFAAGVLAWGWMVIADSPMFSALSAAAAPPAYVGSALTMQNAIGFAIPVGPLLLVPWLAQHVGWQWALLALGVGPALGWPWTHRLATRAARVG